MAILKKPVVFKLRAETIRDGHNHAVHSSFKGNKYIGMIVRAKMDGRFVDPEVLDGKRAYAILTKKTDRYGNKRPYLFLYAREDNMNATEGLATITVAMLKKNPSTQPDTILDLQIFSASKKHWDRLCVFHVYPKGGKDGNKSPRRL